MTAQDLSNALFNASLAVMILTLVAGLGISLTVRQLVEPVSRGGVLATTVIVNSLLAPLIGIGIILIAAGIEFGPAAARKPSKAAPAAAAVTATGSAA